MSTDAKPRWERQAEMPLFPVVTTRSEPVDGKNGAYYLYIRLEYK